MEYWFSYIEKKWNQVSFMQMNSSPKDRRLQEVRWGNLHSGIPHFHQVYDMKYCALLEFENLEYQSTADVQKPIGLHRIN